MCRLSKIDGRCVDLRSVLQGIDRASSQVCCKDIYVNRGVKKRCKEAVLSYA